MRKHLLAAFGVLVDALIGAFFSADALAGATVMLGLVCAWLYRVEIRNLVGGLSPSLPLSAPPDEHREAEGSDAPWHEDLNRCHQELVKYIREPYDYPIGQQEVAATHAFLPHIVRLCHVLDEHDISHPPLDTSGLTFTGTGKWGDFMARLMAVRGDLEEARKVYPKMLKGSGDDRSELRQRHGPETV